MNNTVQIARTSRYFTVRMITLVTIGGCSAHWETSHRRMNFATKSDAQTFIDNIGGTADACGNLIIDARTAK